ncbi:bifunctional metallophosphatase/5'-nucleotidase [Paludisphaera soli]|uniref:bifunctional metallophosphatase/5'-nucleotidase n=1 Tax=Paludisphaera soli TaxID=2712865 RepID=UPI0013EBFA73|nr:bifunctional metallophosphatase/5'-nucleotidase [Paludisphaera soli]
MPATRSEPQWAAAALLAASAVHAPTALAEQGGPASISLVYMADLHAQLEPHAEFFWQDGDERAEVGGVARIASAVKAIRAERPGGVLFLDAGDTIQGSAAAAWTKGEAVVAPLNALGLDLGVPGNWEVVYGGAILKQRAAGFRHPLIAANLRDGRSGKLLFPPYLVKEVGGVRVGVIGFTDPDVPERQPPSYSEGLAFDGADVLQPLIAELRGLEKVDVVTLRTHIDLPKSIRLAETLKRVDFVLSGDTHERTYEPIVRGETWVVEHGGFGSFLGRLDFAVRDGQVVDRKWELIELRADGFAEDREFKRVVDETLAPLRTRLDRVVGRTDVPLMRYNVVETSLDDVLSDALREAAGAEIGLSNGFRFSPPLAAGPIRESDLWDWYPINTKLKVGRVTGRQLRAFWERELEHVFAEDPTRLFGGWLPRPSGMTLRFVAHAPEGERVRETRVGGERLEDDRAYSLVACERKGDAPDNLCRIPHVQDPAAGAFHQHPFQGRLDLGQLRRHPPPQARGLAQVLRSHAPHGRPGPLDQLVELRVAADIKGAEAIEEAAQVLHRRVAEDLGRAVVADAVGPLGQVLDQAGELLGERPLGQRHRLLEPRLHAGPLAIVEVGREPHQVVGRRYRGEVAGHGEQAHQRGGVVGRVVEAPEPAGGRTLQLAVAAVEVGDGVVQLPAEVGDPAGELVHRVASDQSHARLWEGRRDVAPVRADAAADGGDGAERRVLHVEQPLARGEASALGVERLGGAVALRGGERLAGAEPGERDAGGGRLRPQPPGRPGEVVAGGRCDGRGAFDAVEQGGHRTSWRETRRPTVRAAAS